MEPWADLNLPYAQVIFMGIARLKKKKIKLLFL